MNKKFDISPSIIQICDSEFNWSNLIIDLFIRGLNSKTKHVKNLAWSLFYATLIKHDSEILRNSNFTFKWISARGGRNSAWLSNSFEAIQIGKQLYNETYSKLVDCILGYFGFDELINRIYSRLEVNNENITLSITEKQAAYATQLSNLISYLNRKRNLLRSEIINIRCRTQDRYSDISLVDEPFVRYEDGCHLFDVYRIKDQIKFYLDKDPYTPEETLKTICDQASDPNNGLLMPKNIHKAFDDRLFDFNHDGEIIFQKENSEIINSLGLTNARIKSCVLNDRMINYLKRRI